MMIEGRVLGGRYQIQDKIGSGGMAAVFRGIDNVLNRAVAIKVMLPQYASDPTFAARFRQEAQAAAALSSPYIVGVYDWGQDGDTYYIVMEYIRGTNLKTGIRTHGALTPRKVAQIGAQVCAALSVAHRHEIIHRDIKPQNIMIQPDGTARVMDFGIARAKNSHLTQTNSVLGTAHYVSPEQTQGKELGPESDLYSLGVVMYEAACGKLPFDGDDAISVALKQVNEQPIPPSQLNPKIDTEFEAIILKCMSKKPEMRFHSADELRRVLNNYIAGRPTGVLEGYSPSQAPTQVIQNGASALEVDSTRVMHKRPTVNGRVGVGGAAHGANYSHPEQESKKKLWPIALAAIGAIICIMVAVFFLLNSNKSSIKPVPNLIGYDEMTAVKAIEQAGFVKGSVVSEYNDSAEVGTVIDQDPDQGIERPSSTKINIVLSKGPAPKESVLVPDIKNMSTSEAERVLKERKLKLSAAEPAYHDSIPAGKIASQEPGPGQKALEGDTITYVLSLGPENKPIPNVTGKKLEEAQKELEEAGFSVNVKEERSSSVAEGRVISQNPAAGTNSKKDAIITLTVSIGKQEAEVPNVVGMSKNKAIATLEAAGFKAKVEETFGSHTDKVIQQDIKGGIKLELGSTVVITVSSAALSTEPVGDEASNRP